MSDLEDIPAETPLSPLDAILRRHRREKKELQGKILSLKKAITKNDKKKKKEISVEITRLEEELTSRHALELSSFGVAKEDQKPEPVDVPISIVKAAADISLEDTTKKELNNEHIKTDENLSTPGTPKLSKARKRREKKNMEERERQRRIELESAELADNSERKKEDDQLKEILGEMNLKVYDIPPDGHCLYAAACHQLEYHGSPPEAISTLRSKTASYLLQNRDEFINYMEENLASSQEQFEKYCRDIDETACWGGQVEIQVLSKVLERQIRVIQAEGPCLIFGENYPKPSLDLIFHRHMLQLGAHYNSAVSTE